MQGCHVLRHGLKALGLDSSVDRRAETQKRRAQSASLKLKILSDLGFRVLGFEVLEQYLRVLYGNPCKGSTFWILPGV